MIASCALHTEQKPVNLTLHTVYEVCSINDSAHNSTACSSPTLEIEELDGDDEDSREKQHPQEENRTYSRQEVMLEAKVAAQILLHGCLHCGSNDLQRGGVIAELGHYKPVDGPCQGAEPVVPDPPARNVLSQYKRLHGI